MKNKSLITLIAMILISGIAFTGIRLALAEKPDGFSTPESGATSRIKTIYDSLISLSHGSDDAGAWGDWGAYWNRLRSSAGFTPSGDTGLNDVKSGITYNSNSRTSSTGTYPSPTNCATMQYPDNHASATPANNCSLTWEIASPAVTGDDKKDPRTGLVWSQPLKNEGGSVVFVVNGANVWSWDGTTNANSIAVGGKTASQLCSERGNNWRLPTQNEFIQAWIDGGYFNMVGAATTNWTATEVTAANSVYFILSSGVTNSQTKVSDGYVRCVR